MAEKEIKPKICIDNSHIRDLLLHMGKKNYDVANEDQTDKRYLDICYKLWKEDYECIILENTNGALCSSYPSKIIIPQYEIASRISEHSNNSITFSTKPIDTEKAASDNTEEIPEKSGDTAKVAEDDVEEIAEGDDNVKDNEKETTDSEVASIITKNDQNVTHNEDLGSDKDGLQKEATSEQNDKKIDLPQSHRNVESESFPLPQNSEVENDPTPSLENCTAAPRRLARLIHLARTARIRNRFPIPALLCNGKNVCRSGTLSCWVDTSVKTLIDATQRNIEEFVTEAEVDNVDGARSSDIILLKSFKISSIIDLMVENKKQVFYSFITVSSSEKVDKEKRYECFKIFSLPYPGCEFFKNFVENSHCSQNLIYDWSQAVNDAELTIPSSEAELSQQICGDWNDYKNWNLRVMTQRYLKLIMACLKEESEESGLLIHCISGWDRTPLFISLIRLTLWAEGLVHTSLDAKQMLFFTLAYDWFLFGHLFRTRLNSNENILYFCFEFLLVLIKEETAEINTIRRRHASNENNLDSLDKIGGMEIGTPTSFGSSTSLASTSSNTACAKVSPYKTSQKEDQINWPFNKENGFTFDGISDPGAEGCQSADVIDMPARQEGAATFKVVSSSRSPLKDRNTQSKEFRLSKASVEDVANLSTSNNSTASSSSSASDGSRAHKKSSHLGRKTNLNGILKDLTKRSRRGSGSSAKYNISTDSVELDSSGESKLDASNAAASSTLGSSSSSMPVPVPVPSPGGGVNRSRHNSSCSSIGSWQFVTGSPSRDLLGSVDSCQSSRTSLPYEMIDSTNTITEEMTPSSHGSDRSIEHFNQHCKRKKLSEVRELFYKLYGEIPELNKSKPTPFLSLYGS